MSVPFTLLTEKPKYKNVEEFNKFQHEHCYSTNTQKWNLDYYAKAGSENQPEARKGAIVTTD